MLRATTSRKREVSTCSGSGTSSALTLNSNTIGRSRVNISGHSWGKQGQFGSLAESKKFLFPFQTVHTSSKLVPISRHNTSHTSKQPLDESSNSSVHNAPALSQEQLATKSSVNFVQLDQQLLADRLSHTANAEAPEITVAAEQLQINTPSHLKAESVGNNADAETHFRSGYEQAQKGQYKAALKAFKLALQLDPKHSSSYHYLGVIYVAIGKQNKAIANFLRSLEYAPPNSKLLLETYSTLGQSYISLEMFRESLDVMDKIILLESTNKLAQYNRGFALMMLEIFDYALKCFNVTLHLDPQHLGSLQCKTYCLIMQRKFEDAIELVQQAEVHYPADMTLKHYKEYAYKRFFKQHGVYPLTDILNAQRPVQQSSHRDRASFRLFDHDD